MALLFGRSRCISNARQKRRYIRELNFAGCYFFLGLKKKPPRPPVEQRWLCHWNEKENTHGDVFRFITLRARTCYDIIRGNVYFRCSLTFGHLYILYGVFSSVNVAVATSLFFVYCLKYTTYVVRVPYSQFDDDINDNRHGGIKFANVLPAADRLLLQFS